MAKKPHHFNGYLYLRYDDLYLQQSHNFQFFCDFDLLSA